MRKKLLAVLLALALVLAFSGMAMAENPKLSVDLKADSGPASIVFNNEGAVSGGTVFAFYDVYCSDKATKVTVTVNVDDGYDFGLGGETPSVTISDTGIGIPEKDQARVFERFYRVDKSHSKEIGGTGLGLSIVKHGAQFHGAEVILKSEPGVGTSITLKFSGKNKA